MEQNDEDDKDATKSFSIFINPFDAWVNISLPFGGVCDILSFQFLSPENKIN